MGEVSELAELAGEDQAAGTGGAIVGDVMDGDAREAELVEAALAGRGGGVDRTGYTRRDRGVGDGGVEEGVRGGVEGEVGVGDCFGGGRGLVRRVGGEGERGGVEEWEARKGEERDTGEYHTLTSRFEEGGQAHAEDVGARRSGGGSRHCKMSKFMGVVMKLEEGCE